MISSDGAGEGAKVSSSEVDWLDGLEAGYGCVDCKCAGVGVCDTPGPRWTPV